MPAQKTGNEKAAVEGAEMEIAQQERDRLRRLHCIRCRDISVSPSDPFSLPASKHYDTYDAIPKRQLAPFPTQKQTRRCLHRPNG